MSGDLRHFPQYDPGKLDNNEAHKRIEREIAEYLASGKTIKQVDHTANKSFNEPLKRTRKEQIKTLKKRPPIYQRGGSIKL